MFEVSELRHVLSFFEDVHEYTWPDEDIIQPVLQRPDVQELLACLTRKQDDFGYIDKVRLKAQIIAAYDTDDVLWLQLNATLNGKEWQEREAGFGLHFVSMCLWG